MRYRLQTLLLSVVACVVIVLAGCAVSHSPTNSGSGTLMVELTDAPTDLLSEVNVYIASVSVKVAGEPTELSVSEVGLVELLALQGKTQVVGTANVPAGTYERFLVVLDETRSNVVEIASGEEKPLRLANDEIHVAGGFEVLEGGETTVLLDFDVGVNIRQEGNGDWLLLPVIVQVAVEIQ